MDINGLWSANIFYYDDFEDYLLCFENDGNGFYNYSRPDYDEIDTFKWNLESGILRFIGIERIIVYEDIVQERKTSDFSQEIAIFRGKEKTFTSQLIETIEFPDEVIFGDTKYGLIERNILSNKLYQDLKRKIKKHQGKNP